MMGFEFSSFLSSLGSVPGNPTNDIDYHTWCVDEKCIVCDYPIHQLKEGVEIEIATDNVIYRPWSAHMIVEWLPKLDKIYDKFMKDNSHITMEQLLESIANNKFPTGNCYIRAKLLHLSNPKKYAIIIGSLGFVQEDDNIFWEYG